MPWTGTVKRRSVRLAVEPSVGYLSLWEIRGRWHLVWDRPAWVSSLLRRINSRIQRLKLTRAEVASLRTELKELEQHAEYAYDQMYEVHDYHSAKEWKDEAVGNLIRAVKVAKKLCLDAEAQRLDKRMDHILNVWSHQFR